MKSHTGVLNEARLSLLLKKVPVPDQERLLDLLNLLLSIMDDKELEDGSISKQLVDVLAENGN
jgi:hypothetical protein